MRGLALGEFDQDEQEVVSGQPGGRDDAEAAQGEKGVDLLQAAAVLSAETVPELHWAGGYPFAVVLMAAVCTSLYVVFKKKDWL